MLLAPSRRPRCPRNDETEDPRFSFGAIPCTHCYLHVVSQQSETGARRLSGTPVYSYAVTLVQILEFQRMPELIAQAPPLIVHAWVAVAIALATAVVGAGVIGAFRKCRARGGADMSSPYPFVAMEFFDVLTETVTLTVSWAAGDLNFSNDDGALMICLGTTNIVSMALFIIEIVLCRRHPERLSDRLALLQCLHLGVEDVFQMTLYAIAGASKSASGLGLGLAWIFALSQSALCIVLRAIECAGLLHK